MFTDAQHTGALNWIKKAIRSDLPKNKLNPLIDDVVNNPKRRTRFLLWAIWAQSEGLSKIDETVLIEFFHQNPKFIDQGSPFFRELILKLERDQLMDQLKDGTDCPTCGQYCKEYKRSFNTNQAIFLKSLVKLSLLDEKNGGDGWVHHSEIEYTGRDYTMVAHWGLAETARTKEDKDGKRKKKNTGLWKPTTKGIEFVKGQKTIPSFVLMFDGKVTHSDDATQVTFENALGKPFVFSELFKPEIKNV